jgi:hypothetical protein
VWAGEVKEEVGGGMSRFVGLGMGTWIERERKNERKDEKQSNRRERGRGGGMEESLGTDGRGGLVHYNILRQKCRTLLAMRYQIMFFFLLQV